MADRTNKATGIKVISQVGRDPEINRYKRVKEEEERLRAEMRRDSKQRRIRDRAPGRGLSSGYLEGGDSDDEEEVSLAAIKNKFKRGRNGNNMLLMSRDNELRNCFLTTEQRPMYSSDDEEDSDIEASKAKRLEQVKKKALKESDEESEAGSKHSSRSRSKSKSKSPSRSRSGSRSRYEMKTNFRTTLSHLNVCNHCLKTGVLRAQSPVLLHAACRDRPQGRQSRGRGRLLVQCLGLDRGRGRGPSRCRGHHPSHPQGLVLARAHDPDHQPAEVIRTSNLLILSK